MVTMSAVSKWYQKDACVLEQVTFKIDKGDFLYLVGGSGAGKSTLLRLLVTEEEASLGTVSLFGYALNQINAVQLRSIRRLLGYVPQDVRLIPDLTVFDNIALSLKLSGRRLFGAAGRAKITEVLGQVGLDHRAQQLASALSGGEAQRVAVARALVRSPELILADEPTGAQSRDECWTLMELFLKLNRLGTTVILATHDRDLVRRVRRKCAVLRGGHLSIEDALCTF